MSTSTTEIVVFGSSSPNIATLSLQRRQISIKQFVVVHQTMQ